MIKFSPRMRPRGTSAALSAGQAPNGGTQQMGLVRPDAAESNGAASGGGLQLLVMQATQLLGRPPKSLTELTEVLSQTIGKLQSAPKGK
jgi:hypothetical protein